jgi:hypothetical protein
MTFYQAKDRLILCKLESAYGTDNSTAAADALRVRSIEIEPLQADEVERELIRGYAGNYDVILANQRVAITLEVEFAASGAAGTAPRWGPLLEACQHHAASVSSTGVTYTPSVEQDSATIHYLTRKPAVSGGSDPANTLLHKLTGCRGTFSINCEVGQIPTITFNMVGIFNAPVDGADVAPTYTAQAVPDIFNKTNTTGFQLIGFAAALQSYSFDQNAVTTYRELVGGTKEIIITDRRPTGTAVIEAVDLDDSHNYFTDATGSSTGTNTFQHGQTAGNIITFSAPQTDIGAPTYSESDGIVMLNLPFRALPTASANDDYSIVLT